MFDLEQKVAKTAKVSRPDRESSLPLRPSVKSIQRISRPFVLFEVHSHVKAVAAASHRFRSPHRKRKCAGRTDSILESCPPNEFDRDYHSGKTAKASVPKIDRSETGVSRLQNGQERLAWRRIYARGRDLLLPGLCGRHRLHMRLRRETRLLTPGTKAYAGRAASGRAALRRACTEGRTKRRTR